MKQILVEAKLKLLNFYLTCEVRYEESHVLWSCFGHPQQGRPDNNEICSQFWYHLKLTLESAIYPFTSHVLCPSVQKYAKIVAGRDKEIGQIACWPLPSPVVVQDVSVQPALVGAVPCGRILDSPHRRHREIGAQQLVVNLQRATVQSLMMYVLFARDLNWQYKIT